MSARAKSRRIMSARAKSRRIMSARAKRRRTGTHRDASLRRPTDTSRRVGLRVFIPPQAQSGHWNRPRRPAELGHDAHGHEAGDQHGEPNALHAQQAIAQRAREESGVSLHKPSGAALRSGDGIEGVVASDALDERFDAVGTVERAAYSFSGEVAAHH